MLCNIVINTTSEQFPGGTVAGDWHIDASLAGSSGTPPDNVYEGTSPSTTFDLTDGETFVVNGYRLDAGGNPLGSVVSAQFVVKPDMVAIDVAGSLTVTPVTSARAAKK